MIKAIEKIDNLSYKDRLIEEFLTLESRIKLLASFLTSPTFKGFSFIYKLYLRKQYCAMNTYLKYLSKRMKYLNIDEKAINFYITEEKAKSLILKENLKRIEEDLKGKKETKEKKSKSKKSKKND